MLMMSFISQVPGKDQPASVAALVYSNTKTHCVDSMFPGKMVIVNSKVILPLAGLLAVAAAEPQYGCKPQTICVDAINKCGVKYGGYVDLHCVLTSGSGLGV